MRYLGSLQRAFFAGNGLSVEIVNEGPRGLGRTIGGDSVGPAACAVLAPPSLWTIFSLRGIFLPNV